MKKRAKLKTSTLPNLSAAIVRNTAPNVNAIIQLGQKVRVKPLNVRQNLEINWELPGGEATVTRIDEDNQGVIYIVKMHRNGKQRVLRESSLVIHRKNTKVKNIARWK